MENFVRLKSLYHKERSVLVNINHIVWVDLNTNMVMTDATTEGLIITDDESIERLVDKLRGGTE
jgi:hypothetical protein